MLQTHAGHHLTRKKDQRVCKKSSWITSRPTRAPPSNPVKRRKLTWFGHVTRHKTLPKTILQGTLEGGRKHGRQHESWLDNVKEWTRMDSPTLLRAAKDRTCWPKHRPSCPPLRPPAVRGMRWGEVRWGDGSDSDEEETHANHHHPLLSALIEQREDSADSDFDAGADGTARESDVDMEPVAPIIIILCDNQGYKPSPY